MPAAVAPFDYVWLVDGDMHFDAGLFHLSHLVQPPCNRHVTAM